MSASTIPVNGTVVPPDKRRDAKRVPVFDGIRGVCAIMLLVVHVAWVAAFTGSYTDPPKVLAAAIPINGFQIGVGVFFLLSGLFLYQPFAYSIITGKPRPETGPYLVRRALRLLPLYYLVVAVALLALNFNNIDSVWYVLRPIVLMQNYDAQFMAGLDITWTVPTEIQWYIVLPILAWLTAKWARRASDPVSRARRLMLPVPILLIIGLAWTAYVHSPMMGEYPKEYWWPISMAANIAIGMWIGIKAALTKASPENTPKLFRIAGKYQKTFWLLALLTFCANMFKPWSHPGYGDYDNLGAALAFYVFLLMFGVFVIAPMVAPGENSRLINVTLGNPVIVFLGRISYGIYLWHFVVMNLYLRNGNLFGEFKTLPELRGTVGFWELESAVFGISVVLATITFFFFERPIMALGEKWIASRAAKRAPVAPVTELVQPAQKRPAA